MWLPYLASLVAAVGFSLLIRNLRSAKHGLPVLWGIDTLLLFFFLDSTIGSGW
jgi:hypothetical protein